MNQPTQAPIMSTADERERLRLFISSVTDYAIYMLSPKGAIVTWNAGAQRFKGYTANEIVGQHFSRFYTDEDRASGLPQRALRIAESTGKFEAEGWRVRKDGTRFWASVVIDPIRDENGELAGFAKITRDITEKKLAQEALRESEERFRILVQGVNDYAIYMLSPQGVITNWNSGAKRIKGYAEEEVIGSHFSRFYTEEDRASGLPMRALAQAAETGRFEAEGWRVRKDGTRFWAHVVIDRIRNEMGHLVGFAKVTRDITERRQAAEDLERARQAQFETRKLEALGSLTAGLAQEFRGILEEFSSGVASLRALLKDPDQLRALELLEQANARGSLLLDRLRVFGRQQPLDAKPVDINALISAGQAKWRDALRPGLQFALELAPGDASAVVDAGQLEAAMLNLLSNAADATPDGGTVVVSVRVASLGAGEVGTLPAGDYVAVSVRDTGMGMPPDIAARAVEPFFTTKPTGKRTGTGLSQVCGMVQQSRGDLAIASVVGEGTTVTLYFPVIASG